MDKLYERIRFSNNQEPALNESNLNKISEALDEIDNRVIEGYTKAVLAGQTAEVLNQTIENIQKDVESASQSALDASNSAAQAEQSAIDTAEAIREEMEGYTSAAEQSAQNAADAAEQARITAENIGEVIHPRGSVLFADLPPIASMSVGDMYNILDDFTTTSDFIIGAGFTYSAGSNVYLTQSNKLDVFAGVFVSGLKLPGDENYRRGGVEIPFASETQAGVVKVDGTTIGINEAGELYLAIPDAESEVF